LPFKKKNWLVLPNRRRRLSRPAGKSQGQPGVALLSLQMPTEYANLEPLVTNRSTLRRVRCQIIGGGGIGVRLAIGSRRPVCPGLRRRPNRRVGGRLRAQGGLRRVPELAVRKGLYCSLEPALGHVAR
jgi:hypothetical protein